MKKIAITILLIMLKLNVLAQTKSLKSDSLHFSKICFGEICLGDKTFKMKKILGGKVTEYLNKNEGEMVDLSQPFKVYNYGDDKIGKFISFEEKVQEVGVITNISYNNIYPLDNLLKIGATTNEMRSIFKNSYEIALRKNQLDKTKSGAVYLKIYGQPKGFLSINTVIIELSKGRVVAIYCQDENSI
jgi:hypothetical protein